MWGGLRALIVRIVTIVIVMMMTMMRRMLVLLVMGQSVRADSCMVRDAHAYSVLVRTKIMKVIVMIMMTTM
jgi:hypothetical protein